MWDPSANDRVGSLLPHLTQIRYPVRPEARVSPKVFDLSGRQVATWVDEVREPAERTVPFGAGDLWTTQPEPAGTIPGTGVQVAAHNSLHGMHGHGQRVTRFVVARQP